MVIEKSLTLLEATVVVFYSVATVFDIVVIVIVVFFLSN